MHPNDVFNELSRRLRDIDWEAVGLAGGELPPGWPISVIQNYLKELPAPQFAQFKQAGGEAAVRGLIREIAAEHEHAIEDHEYSLEDRGTGDAGCNSV